MSAQNESAVDAARGRIAKRGERFARQLVRLELERDALRATVTQGVALGITESEAARLSGVTRITVRHWLGKG